MKYFFTFLLFVTSHFAYAQGQEQQEIDGLLKKIQSEKSDLVKAAMLDSVAFDYANIDPDLGLKYAKDELALALKIGSSKTVAVAKSTIGMMYEYKSDYPEALEYYYAALTVFEKLGDQYNIGSNCSHIGIVYQTQANYSKALEFHNKSLKINEEVKDTLNIGNDLGNIGNVYMTMGDLSKALDYDLRSLDIFKRLNNSNGIAHNLGNIGNVYKVQLKYSEALGYDLQALKIFEELGDKGGVALNLGNIGGVYLAIAKDTSGKIKYSDGVIPAKAACINKAIEYLNKSIVLSNELGQMDNIMEFNQGLAEAYSIAGNYKAALESYKLYTAAKDSVFSSTDKQKIAQLGMQRDLELKNKQIQIDELEVAKKENKDAFFIVCAALALLVIGLVLRKLFPGLFKI